MSVGGNRNNFLGDVGHAGGMGAEVFPSHAQKKIGPIGRKKLQENELRKRSRSLLTAHNAPDNAQNDSILFQQPESEAKIGEKASNDTEKNIDVPALNDKDDLSKTEAYQSFDDITGVPLESVWLRRMKEKQTDEDINHFAQAARKIRLLSHTPSFKEDINDLDDDGFSALHVATQYNRIGVMEDLIIRGADIDIRARLNAATPLHIAAKYNCFNAAKLLLRYNADVMAKLTNGHTPIHICCRKGHVDIAKLLLSKRLGCINARDNDMTTPLHQAINYGDVNLCTLLVEYGADIRAKDINDVTPLIQAAQCGFKDIVQYLLSVASQIGIFLPEYILDVDNEGSTVLHLAVANRHIHVARALIDRGAPTECCKPNGFTPLHQAAIFGEVGMVEMLIDKGAETEVFDNEQMTPLHRAALYNRVDVILLLIRQGLFLDSRDEDNFTPLLCAAWKGQTDAARSLLRYGADIQAVDKGMKSCLHWAVEMQHVDFVLMLFEHGHGGDEIINWHDRDEQTALHYAAEVGNVKLIHLLIEYSAKVDVKDITEKSPLHIAAESGHLECVQILLEACPIPLNDDDIDDMTPLLVASENGYIHVVKYLIKMGADMSKRNDDRRSALSLAAIKNEIPVMTALLDNNANVNALDKDKNTPLHLCARAGHPGPTTLLLNCGADLTAQNIHGQYPLDVAIEYKQESVANAILSSRFWKIAMNNRDMNGQLPMQRLIQFVPDTALLVMDQCVTRSHEDPHHPDLQITYDFKYIDPGPEDPSSLKGGRNFALETMVQCSREKLLAHELSQSILAKKWSKFAGWINCFDLLFYTTFLIVMVFYLEFSQSLLKKGYDRDYYGCPVVNDTSSSEYSEIGDPYLDYDSSSHLTGNTSYLKIVDAHLIGIQIYLVLFVCFKILEDVALLPWQKFGYFYNFENWMHLILYVTVIGFVWPPYYPPCDMNYAFGAMAIFVAWMNFIFVLQRFDFFGLYVTMFFTTLKSLIKAMVVYAFFIVGFALAFFICFVSTIPSFRDEWQSILTTFTMTLGEINKADLFDSPDLNLYPFDEVANVIFVAFLFLMPMVLINLTIGISVGDIDSILQSAYIQRYALQVKMIFDLEKRFPKFIQRKLWQQTYSFYPNRKTPTLWGTIKLFLIGSGRKSSSFLGDNKEESTTIDDLMSGFSRHERMLTDLSVVIHRQNDILRRLAEKHDIKVEL